MNASYVNSGLIRNAGSRSDFKLSHARLVLPPEVDQALLNALLSDPPPVSNSNGSRLA